MFVLSDFITFGECAHTLKIPSPAKTTTLKTERTEWNPYSSVGVRRRRCRRQSDSWNVANLYGNLCSTWSAGDERKKKRKLFFIAVICIRNWLIKMLNKRKYVQSLCEARAHSVAFTAREIDEVSLVDWCLLYFFQLVVRLLVFFFTWLCTSLMR